MKRAWVLSLALAASVVGADDARRTYTNPVDVDYRYNFEQVNRQISYRTGADPVIVLQDLLDLVHWLTRLKVTPEIAAGAPDLERTRGREMTEGLSMAHLTRAWQMLLKGLQETLAAPSPTT